MAFSQVTKTLFNSTGAATSHSPTFATPTANNLLICVVNADAVINSFTAGWTQACAAVNFTALRIYYKVAAGSETGVTVGLAATRACQTNIMEYSGAATVSPLDLANAQGGSSTTPTTPSITTTNADDLLIVGFGMDDTVTFGSLTGTYTQESDQRTTGGGGGAEDALLTASRIVSATGAQSAACAISGNVNQSWTAAIAAFKMGAAGATPAAKRLPLLGAGNRRPPAHRARPALRRLPSGLYLERAA